LAGVYFLPKFLRLPKKCFFCGFKKADERIWKAPAQRNNEVQRHSTRLGGMALLEKQGYNPLFQDITVFYRVVDYCQSVLAS
jgi:hypothetical protein